MTGRHADDARATLDMGAAMRDPSPMPGIRSASYADLDALLTKLAAKVKPWEVHALYLGALTSTNLRLGPQQLIDRLLGDEVELGDNAMDSLGTILGYWNTLVSERDAGRVHLAPLELPKKPAQSDLLAFVKRRHEELEWFVRGIDAGGDDPFEFGEKGKKLLEGIAEGGAFLHAYVDLLERNPTPPAAELAETRKMLLKMVATVEGLIADLMDVADGVRREALAAYTANAGGTTDDGVEIAKPIKVGRNEKCPCGSGRKWKKCCGTAGAVQ